METKDFYRSDALSVEVDEDTDSLKYLNPDANEDGKSFFNCTADFVILLKSMSSYYHF